MGPIGRRDGGGAGGVIIGQPRPGSCPGWLAGLERRPIRRQSADSRIMFILETAKSLISLHCAIIA